MFLRLRLQRVLRLGGVAQAKRDISVTKRQNILGIFGIRNIWPKSVQKDGIGGVYPLYNRMAQTHGQLMGDAYHQHADCRNIFWMFGVVLFMNLFTWLHASKDAKANWCVNKNHTDWLKYMREKQWCQVSGVGLKYYEFNGSLGKWPGIGDSPTEGSACVNYKLLYKQYGFQEPWRRDVYKLLVDINTYKPDHCPYFPLPLGGCGCECNKDSSLTKLLEYEGKEKMWCIQKDGSLHKSNAERRRGAH